ncbi:carboxymuconolactone decarboxylase family protein [Nocardioides sp. SYSU D00038]|uniref:carboxymuconolactone decarboxylase family protein n=1 Tax=Nocardioides sp. SYSU D00038 TaxID=2812554 RepID=UPI001967951D|nr:hypothetical protein [Nocardioides sp. SYSU D00038]
MSASFLGPAPDSDGARRLVEEDLDELGYVMNGTRLWAHHPAAMTGLFDLLGVVNEPVRLSLRERALLTVAAAATRRDSYCALAWGAKLAAVADEATAAAVLRGEDPQLDDRERALVTWARLVATDPNATTASDVEALRTAGWSEAEVLAMTVHVALRMAFSAVNDALGAAPDPALAERVPAAVRAAVDFGRPPAD